MNSLTASYPFAHASATDRAVINDHLPSELVEMMSGPCGSYFAIAQEKPSLSYVTLPSEKSLKVVVHVGDSREVTLHIFQTHVQPNQGSSLFTLAWKNRVCQHDAYKLYTKSSCGFPAETVNAVYLSCMKDLFENIDGHWSLARCMPKALLDQTTADRNRIDPTWLDMEFIRKRIEN
ncbi:MAG: hypothetical protein LLG04_10395 [Parachlamydia sp.]|nr:hypothetical protein [Parachlamydia sp.]